MKKLPECFIKKSKKNPNQIEFMTEKLINKNPVEHNVEWRSYDDSFNSWIDNKYIA